MYDVTIGIDFGSSGSGFAFLFNDKINDQNDIIPIEISVQLILKFLLLK